MKLALGLDVQTNAKGGKFMSIDGGAVGARQISGRLGKEGGRNTNLQLWTEEVEQGVIDNMIIRSPFRGPPAPSLRASCSAPSR